MKIKTEEHDGNIVLYHLNLDDNETYTWAHRVNNPWPCSQISGKRLWIAVDLNGLFDITLDGKFVDIDSTELTAIVSDFLPDDCKHLWPIWDLN